MGRGEMEPVLWLVTLLTLLTDNYIYLSIYYIPGRGCCLPASSDLTLRDLLWRAQRYTLTREETEASNKAQRQVPGHLQLERHS